MQVEEPLWFKASTKTAVQEVRFIHCESWIQKIVAVKGAYVRKFPNANSIILLYVDAKLIIGQYVDMIDRLKKELRKSLDMKRLRLA